MQTWQTSNGKKKHKGRGESSVATLCLQLADAGLLALLFVAPLFFGGRHTLGRLVFVSLVGLTAVAWFTRQAILGQSFRARTWAYVAWAAAIGLVAIQLLPIPSEWMLGLAPRNLSLLPLWTNLADGRLEMGTWNTLSLTPSSTKIALATLIAYALLFATVHQRLEKLDDIRRLLKFVVIASGLMSCFGLVQYFFSNGQFFWFYEHPHSTTDSVAKGSFTCRNHFAHFLVLGMGPLLAWGVLLVGRFTNRQASSGTHHRSSWGRAEIALLAAVCVAMLLMVSGVLLSFSRGGAVSLAVVMAVALTIYYRRGLISGSHFYGVAVLGLLAVGILSLYGYDRVARRLDNFTTSIASGSLEDLDAKEGRRRIWRANVASIQQGGLFGAGAGSHREIYPVYFAEQSRTEYTHAENGYLQIATENGWLGVGLLVVAFALVTSWCWRAIRAAPTRDHLLFSGAVCASLTANAIHSLWDFVWFIPACMTMTLLLAVCALRLSQLSIEPSPKARPERSNRRWPSVVTAAVAIAGAYWAVSTTLGPGCAALHWDKYLIASSSAKQQSTRKLLDFKQSEEVTDEKQMLSEAMIFNLQSVLSQDPTSARAHRRLAREYLRLFESRQIAASNAMSVDQIRDAAIASQFASADELRNWLHQAFGKNSELLYRAYHHSRRALQLCPLQGDVYLYLAKLCFLEGKGITGIDRYLAQGEKVRPYDGRVLFQIGWQQLNLGRFELATEYWNKAYPLQAGVRLQIIRLLAGRVSALDFLKSFSPDWSSLSYVWRAFRELGSEEDQHVVLHYATVAAQRECPSQSPRLASKTWRTLAWMQIQLQETESAIQSLQKAYALTPDEYAVRRTLGQQLLIDEQYDRAAPHLRWCLARQPGNLSLRNEVVQATKRRLPQNALMTTGEQYK